MVRNSDTDRPGSELVTAYIRDDRVVVLRKPEDALFADWEIQRYWVRSEDLQSTSAWQKYLTPADLASHVPWAEWASVGLLLSPGISPN